MTGWAELPNVSGMPMPFAILQCRICCCVEQRSNHLSVEVHLDGEVGRCPECGQTSRSVHSRYHRHPADWPVSTSRTTLNIEGRRFCAAVIAQPMQRSSSQPFSSASEA